MKPGMIYNSSKTFCLKCVLYFFKIYSNSIFDISFCNLHFFCVLFKCTSCTFYTSNDGLFAIYFV